MVHALENIQGTSGAYGPLQSCCFSTNGYQQSQGLVQAGLVAIRSCEAFLQVLGSQHDQCKAVCVNDLLGAKEDKADSGEWEMTSARQIACKFGAQCCYRKAGAPGLLKQQAEVGLRDGGLHHCLAF